MRLTILYRGPLSSCNYDCGYCPFAKQVSSQDELENDRQSLTRFVQWLKDHPQHQIGILFTPWGEALIRKWYQDAIGTLSHLSHIWRVAIQTNLSCQFEWLKNCDLSRVAFWATYHPEEISRQRFLTKCAQLDQIGARYSVGMVGLKEYQSEIEAMRAALAPDVYLWVNAYKDRPTYYQQSDLEQIERIDPLFRFNTVRHPSLGKPCRAGESVISVDGEGTVRRCHFIKEPIGNLYSQDLEAILFERPCTNLTCGCHIGYVHRQDLGLYEIFGEGVLERIPTEKIW